jgi:hypothetical protein
VLSLFDRLFALIANWPSLGGHEYARGHWSKCSRPGIDPDRAADRRAVGGRSSPAVCRRRPARLPRRTLTVMLIQGHGPGARDKPAPSACVNSGHAVAVNARSPGSGEHKRRGAAHEAPVTRALLLASLDMMAVPFWRYQTQLSGIAFRACTCGAAALKAKTLECLSYAL